jgi:hypothetical protein
MISAGRNHFSIAWRHIHASTREYILRVAHESERVERHKSRKWNRNAIILHDAVSDLEVTHEWEPGVVINRLAAVRDKRRAGC